LLATKAAVPGFATTERSSSVPETARVTVTPTIHGTDSGCLHCA